MIDYSHLAAACQLLDLVVHQVRGQLAGRSAALGQTPYDPVFRSGGVHLDDTEGLRRFAQNVAEIFSGAGHHEELARKVRHRGSDIGKGGVKAKVVPDLLYRLHGDPVGKVSAVSLVKSELPAVLGKACKVLCKFRIHYFHDYKSSSIFIF